MKGRIVTISAILLAFVFCCMFSHSCANTTTAPGGGPKDTLPPVLLKVTPDFNTTGFPVVDGKILLLYDEYTVVKSSSDIFLSPPMKKRPIAKVKGKNIVITFQDTLRLDQTYTIDFGKALADNNEGNIAPRLVYTFSTGNTIDSLYFTGTVTDSKTLKPVSGALVTAFSDLSDSACFKALPDAAVKTDEWGFFTIRNIKDTLYRIYAYSAADNDYMYNPDGDQVAFYDSVYRPIRVVKDSIYELRSFDMKDTLGCKKRESMVSLKMFKELQSVQYLQNSGRHSDKQGYLKFSAGNVEIIKMDFPGFSDDEILVQYNRMRDSLDFWINSKYKAGDSLLVNLTYMKTDSTGNLSQYTEHLSLALDQAAKDAAAQANKNKKNQPDTVFKLNISSSDNTVESDGVSIASDLPILEVVTDSIHLTEKNPKGQVSEKEFILEKDSLDIRKFIARTAEPMIKGYDYELTFSQGAFVNLNSLPNALTSAKFKIPQSEELSTLHLNFTGVDDCYIVELTKEDMGNAVRTYNISSDCTITIPYLESAKYAVRVSCDGNRNGFVDTGNLLEKRQPEEVRFYETEPGKQLLEIPASSEIDQDINIKSLFL